MEEKIIDQIRNFVIIAHIDHGKSTLADRFLEITNTIEKRKMKTQYLDQLELEREKGITIKMAPVKMKYIFQNKEYTLNLIDTPGHSDFSYEVSRALNAVEGAILLVDATQGIQAQTLSNFKNALNANLKIIGAVNKIDLNPFNLNEIIKELAELLNCKEEEIFKISSKTGEGVEELLKAVILKIPPPRNSNLEITRALIFDSFYDDHKGVIASIRIFDGEINQNDEIYLNSSNTFSKIKEIGYFSPHLKPITKLTAGEIGYLATGIKDTNKIKIGDTIFVFKNKKIKDFEKYVLPGYQEPKNVVFVSFYPENPQDYELLKNGLEKLKLNDWAINFEPDQQEVLGRGFKVGFLGKLHFEITAERLKRELKINTIQSFPSVLYQIKTKENKLISITKPEDLPPEYLEILEPIVSIEILIPINYFNNIFPLFKKFRMKDIKTETLNDRIKIKALMPLAELINDFDDQLKSLTQGYGSFNYQFYQYEKADIVKVDFLINGQTIGGLSRFFARESYYQEASKMTEKLKNLLPRQQFAQAIQAKAEGRIIKRENIPALRKDVTGYLYGGDRTRKMKLWQKQKEGKKKLKQLGRVKITADIFKELLKK